MGGEGEGEGGGAEAEAEAEEGGDCVRFKDGTEKQLSKTHT